jgi:UDP-N-acetylmuramoylalanine--D-glutamate ligase
LALTMEDFSGRRALIMGLGLHGGGLESAKYLARHGAELTVTDLRDGKTLAPSIEKLEAALGAGRVRYVLGRHETADFEKADLVIKNPGVRPDSPYLKAARRVETDISLFLAGSPARLSVVTGSKGKSGTASALYWVLNQAREQEPGKTGLPGKAWLGGNITVSPLSFLDQIGEGDDVVLELSSWQLADLRCRLREGRPLLKPRCAVITAIMPDHMDRYAGMEDYVADKRVIYQGQDGEDATIAGRERWGESFLAESRGRPLSYGDEEPGPGINGGWIEGGEGPGLVRLYEGPAVKRGAGEIIEAVPAELLVPGRHQKRNLLAAALALLDLALPAEFVRGSLGRFPGIEHRLEFFHGAAGLRFYNDTAATIPEAARAAVEALEGRGRVLLAAGGSDKGLDLSPLADAAEKAAALVLLAGTGSEKLTVLLRDRGIPFHGPFDSVDAAVKTLLDESRPGDTVLLSPGCASFGMFRNEFDRGTLWKEAVKRLAP